MAYTPLQEEIYQWFHDIPKEAPAIFALAFIFLFGCINFAITCKTRTWFMLIVAFTAGLEVAGYICRVIMLHHPAYGPYVSMQALLIISPIFLALVDYDAVGKLIKMGGAAGALKSGPWVSCTSIRCKPICLIKTSHRCGMLSCLSCCHFISGRIDFADQYQTIADSTSHQSLTRG